MIGSALIATSATAGASPGNLDDIDVTIVNWDSYVVAALTGEGAIQVQVVDCKWEQTCYKHGWTSLGSGFKSVTVQSLTEGSLVAIARRGDGATWYKRGNCSTTSCTWDPWKNLGGSVINIAASNKPTDCAILAGQSSTKRVYQAQICAHSVQGWGYTGGQLSQIANGDNIFGTSASGQVWWYQSGEWKWAGGNVTQPASRFDGIQEMCGLGGSARRLWCYDGGTKQWTNHGGSWRKLDDGQTIGLGQVWDAWTNDEYGSQTWGGKVNEVAWSENQELMVGIGSDYRAWYRIAIGVASGKTWLAL